jgi:hypothetical protein
VCSKWSCGESNPGPRASIQVFSGCSPCCRFSRPRCSHGQVTDRLSQDRVPAAPPDRERPASLLDEAWVRDGDGCPVRPFDHCSGSESEVVAIGVGNYGFPAVVYEMTLASRPASPGTNVPSRNRSAPLVLSSEPEPAAPAYRSQPTTGERYSASASAARAGRSGSACHSPSSRRQSWLSSATWRPEGCGVRS